MNGLKQAEQIRALRGEIAALRAIETPALSFGGVVAQMLGLPGLRGLWPMSVFDSGGNAQDVSGHGHHLTYNGNPTYNVDGGVPYIDLDGTGDYLSRADEADLDITGGEAYVAAPGLTLGGWFYVDAQDDYDNLMGKHASGSQVSYRLQLSSAANARFGFVITTDGVTDIALSSASGSVPTGVWRLCVGRYIPSVSMHTFVNGAWTSLTTGIPASLHSGTAPLEIGSRAASALLDGRGSLCFLCASALSDATIDRLFQTSRGLFGV